MYIVLPKTKHTIEYRIYSIQKICILYYWLCIKQNTEYKIQKTGYNKTEHRIQITEYRNTKTPTPTDQHCQNLNKKIFSLIQFPS